LDGPILLYKQAFFKRGWSQLDKGNSRKFTALFPIASSEAVFLIEYKYMKYCLDTNILFTFQKGVGLGENPEQVIQKLIAVASKKTATFCLPQKIDEEVRAMLDKELEKLWLEFLSHVAVKTPKIYTHSISAGLLYEFVNDYRKRAYDGLKVAEDIVAQVAKNTKSTENRVEFEKSLQPHKESLRLRYRNATRTGTIDSVADLDLILLSVEEDAALVSADEGVVVWGRKFGAKEIDLAVFGQKIREALL